MKSYRGILSTALTIILLLSAGLVFGQYLSANYYYPDKVYHDFQGLVKFTNTTGPAITGTVTPAGVTATGTISGADVRATGELSTVKLDASGATRLQSTLAVKGALTANSTITTTNTVSGADVRASGELSTAKFNASGAAIVNGALSVKGNQVNNGDITTTGTITGAVLSISGAATIGGGTTFTGGTVCSVAVVTYDTTTSARTVTAAESGKTFCTTTASIGYTTTFNLPTAAAGLMYNFVDMNTTSSGDLWITANTGDAINGGTTAKSFKHVATAFGSVTLLAVDATNWIVLGPTVAANWSNDNS